MQKLTDKTKYSIEDGHAIIYACQKGTATFVPAFTCHISCIDIIKQHNSLKIENVILKPYLPKVA